jgi:ubiquinone/menaquinone biosynthesis C-methylase UbiE
MQILHWPVSPELQNETEQHYRSRLARELKDSDPLHIIRQVTFDGVVPDITMAEVRRLFDALFKKFLPEVSGVGLEVGAGPGVFSAVIAGHPGVGKMYALEVCAPIVELLAPKIVSYITHEADKVTGAVGDFDHIQLPDRSVDFAFDFFSLHHSNDLAVTLKEIRRVLKPGGFIFCLDKARPDSYTHADLDALIDYEYGQKGKKLLGIPPERHFTRRMNGEKEYRLKDWKQAFGEAGFGRVEYFNLLKTTGSKVKKLLAILPSRLQTVFTGFLPKPKRSHIFLLESKNRVFVPEIDPFPKEMSLIIAHARY